MESSPEPIDVRDPERRAASHELLALLETSVESLPEGNRLVFMLRDVEGLDIAETAAALSLSQDVVKQRLHRARAMLRKDLYARAGSAVEDAFRFDDRRCDRIVARVLALIAG